MRKLRPLFALAALLGAFALPRQADAVVTPLQYVEGHWFPVRTEALQVQLASIRLAERQAEDTGRAWELEAELWLRNVSLDVTRFDVAAIGGEVLSVERDGAPVTTEPIPIRQDPSLPEATFGEGVRVALELEPERTAVLRIQLRVAGRVDTYGRSLVVIPTQALGLFGGDVRAGHLEAQVLERPYGMQSTLSGATIYDEPINRIVWPLFSWSARVPFQLSYLPPWPMLMAMAEVDRCPDPWEIVRLMSAGELEELTNLVESFDPAMIEFCAHLPLVTHGYVFSSERARAQLLDLSLRRYVPDAGESARAYVPNPAFEEAWLSDAERIYRDTLERYAPEEL